jgi:hypothetical protein
MVTNLFQVKPFIHDNIFILPFLYANPNLSDNSCLVSFLFADGQMDYKSGWLRQFETFPRLSRLHSQGKLIALHTQNLWWRSWKTSPRPNWLHCLPIGLEMRKYNHGSNLTVYLEVIREIVDFASTSLVRSHKKRPLLLVAFTPKPYAPDRGKALLSFFGKKQSFYTKKSYNHRGWLRAITQHRFTLCPFGKFHANQTLNILLTSVHSQACTNNL